MSALGKLQRGATPLAEGGFGPKATKISFAELVYKDWLELARIHPLSRLLLIPTRNRRGGLLRGRLCF